MKQQELVQRAIVDLEAVARQATEIKEVRHRIPIGQRVKLERSRWHGQQRPPTPPEFDRAAENRNRANQIDAEIRELAEAQQRSISEGGKRAQLAARQKKIEKKTVLSPPFLIRGKSA